MARHDRTVTGGFRHSLRFKLLALSLSLLIIPWAGYRFIQDMESILRTTQDDSLKTGAKALASRLASEDFPPATPLDERSPYPQPDLYVHPLAHPPQLDGYAEEWAVLQPKQTRYRDSKGPAFDLLLGAFGDHLYLLLQVDDPRLSYARGPAIRWRASDQVMLAFADSIGQVRPYLIAPRAPGWVSAREVDMHKSRPAVLDSESRIQGQWQESGSGYSLELRMQKKMLGQRLAVSVFDHESGEQQSTSDIRRSRLMGNLVGPDRNLQQLLGQINLPNSRTWLTDRNGQVLARHGRLTQDTTTNGNAQQPAWFVRKLFSLVLRHQAPDSPPIGDDDTRLPADRLRSALQGNPDISHHRPQQGDSLIVSVAYPVGDGDAVKGVLVMEQTTDAILSLQNRAMRQLLTITLLVMTVIGLVLLGYATLLTRRIRRLLREVEQAVTHDGRITGELRQQSSSDEIGDLGRGFSRVLARLSDYNDYLEQMASRLTHELRTPITVVRTSLESSLQVDDQTRNKYLDRALDGTARLDRLVTQLAEATRLERSFDQVEKQAVDLVALLHANLEILNATYPQECFELIAAAQAARVNAAAELITQALEKLIDNAVDFRAPGTAIRITLSQTTDSVTLSVCNQGAPLPDGVDPFRSMVSVRPRKDAKPHLGLGLYLVALIAQFHQGSARAYNLDDGSGVCVEFSLAREG